MNKNDLEMLESLASYNAKWYAFYRLKEYGSFTNQKICELLWGATKPYEKGSFCDYHVKLYEEVELPKINLFLRENEQSFVSEDSEINEDFWDTHPSIFIDLVTLSYYKPHRGDEARRVIFDKNYRKTILPILEATIREIINTLVSEGTDLQILLEVFGAKEGLITGGRKIIPFPSSRVSDPQLPWGNSHDG